LPINAKRPYGPSEAMELSLLQTAGLLAPDPEQLVESGREAAGRRLQGRELLSEGIVGGSFLAAATATALLVHWPQSLSLIALIVVVVAYLAALRVPFEVGLGFAVPTQVVFVAALFLLPTPLAPLVVMGSLTVMRLIDAAMGKCHPSRALHGLADSWYTIGPALVLIAAGEHSPRLSHWPLYLAALCAQFALDAGWGMVRSRLESGVGGFGQLRVLAWVYSVDAALAPIGLLAAVAATDHPLALLGVLPLFGLLASFAQERRARIDNALELSNAYRGTAMLLGEVIEADDAYTGDHSRGVLELALAVADDLGLDAQQRKRVEFGALLHDVGKIAVPKEIINKPGSLTDEEWEIMRRHTIEGETLLHRVGGLLAEAGTVVRSSHEHFDGAGYPDGLAGDDIPIEARVVSCCDAYSAMTTDRSYRPAMPVEEALAEVRACAGSQFDPRVAAALVAVVERWHRVALQNGRLAHSAH
jgi:HD-GYP domain-containing protein (c-di-GMP phosphodiesterase class II)